MLYIKVHAQERTRQLETALPIPYYCLYFLPHALPSLHPKALPTPDHYRCPLSTLGPSPWGYKHAAAARIDTKERSTNKQGGARLY
jgi:hypothetical protein